MKKLLKLATKLLLVTTVMFAVTTPAYADPCPWDWVPGFCPVVNNSQIG